MPTVFHASSPHSPGVWVALSCVCVCAGGASVHTCACGCVYVTNLTFFLSFIPEYVEVSDGHPYMPMTQALKLNIKPTFLVSPQTSHNPALLLCFLTRPLTLPYCTFTVTMDSSSFFKNAMCHYILINIFSAHSFFHSEVPCTQFPGLSFKQISSQSPSLSPSPQLSHK